MLISYLTAGLTVAFMIFSNKKNIKIGQNCYKDGKYLGIWFAFFSIAALWPLWFLFAIFRK